MKKGRRDRAAEQSTRAKAFKALNRVSKDTLESVLANARLMPCELCGALSVAVDAFIPNQPTLYMAPEGKTRVFFIPLCDKHVRQSQANPSIVENHLLNKVNPIGLLSTLEVSPEGDT